MVKKKKVKIDFDSASEAGTHTTTVDGRTPLPLNEAEKDLKTADRSSRPPKQLPEKKTRSVMHDEQTNSDQAVVLAHRPSEPALTNQETVLHRATYDATIEGSQFGLDPHYAKPQMFDSAPAEMVPPDLKLQTPPPVTLLPQTPGKRVFAPGPAFGANGSQAHACADSRCGTRRDRSDCAGAAANTVGAPSDRGSSARTCSGDSRIRSYTDAFAAPDSSGGDSTDDADLCWPDAASATAGAAA